jgi:ribosome-binding factor A
MPKEFNRTQRVSELIRRELAGIIAREMDDPRVRFVSITAVNVSKDLRSAKVYVTQIKTDREHEIDVRSLQKAAGFLRRQLARVLELRNVPALTFVYDSSIERGVELSHLIERAVDSEERASLANGSPPEGERASLANGSPPEGERGSLANGSPPEGDEKHRG